MTKTSFTKTINDDFPLLEKYTPILARVHGDGHPELAEVRDIFKAINDKVKQNDFSQIDLSADFKQLRIITNDYTVPSDGCETYKATYEMLARADQAYHD
ncbi:hypothetical protein [Amphibacillus xylanus]|uniref:Iron-sulfur cluster repair di-iron protein, ric n=1 Tax=Amphibacillus xylanus (strain ATCC 51415 / DSM 6626 / JCM 7361 / LMG 17667 / NBRC 15112 / Ep01) TaxID=698758 RepID=K0IYC0_AMPXN|nr:hypothetical protein [Amphibacillus xylanus]BAM47505.1 hypothetical protein AXY_13730 [Amphibacillus xylanus NBRC 15112]